MWLPSSGYACKTVEKSARYIAFQARYVGARIVLLAAAQEGNHMGCPYEGGSNQLASSASFTLPREIFQTWGSFDDYLSDLWRAKSLWRDGLRNVRHRAPP